MYDVVALGELLIDFVHKETTKAGYPVMQANPGGAPGNFLSTASLFGARAAFIGEVGDDGFGLMLKRTLKESGIDVRGVISDPNVFTTLAFVTLDENGDRAFSFARKPGADTMLTASELPTDIIENTRFFHFGSLSMTHEPARAATQEAVARAKAAGAIITFDPNLRQSLWSNLELAKEQMLWGLRHADIVKISREELEFLFEGDFRAQADRLVAEYGVKLVFATMGRDGCYFVNRNASGQVPTFCSVPTIDTTGAGDIFGGSAVYKVMELEQLPENLNEYQLRDIVTFANAAASLSTTRHGGIPSIPSKLEVEAFVVENAHR